MAVALVLLSSAAAYLLWTLVCLEANVRKARAIGVPVVRIPFGVNNYAWVIFQPFVWQLLAWLPVAWSSYPDFVRYSHRNWHFLEKSHPTASLGPAWALVSPEGISLHFADPDVIDAIFTRWRDFVRPVQKYQMLAIYGPSVFTVGLDDWSRHRKAVAAPFNQDLMSLVWSETLRHAQSILGTWVNQPGAKITSLEDDLRALTFNVLGSTAFQEPLSSKDSKDGDAAAADAQAATDNYRDTLQTVLENAILLMLVPYRYLVGRIIPEHLAKVGRAAALFEAIMLKVLMEETAALDDDGPKRRGLLTGLVRARRPDAAAEQQAEDADASGATAASVKKGGLSAEEVLGNSFIINFAGHDTVLLTLTFTLTMMAVHPDMQEWVREEIAEVSQGRPVDEWPYDYFPRLNRCQAVVLETLRVFAPITGIPKIAAPSGPSLRVGDGVLTIPPGTEVFPLLLGVQTDPKYWDDPYVWRPSRWILDGDGGGEELLVPRKGIFFPWSGGPQNCVGKKFAQVESAAVIACLFQAHRLHVEADPGETQEQAMCRVRDCAHDVNYNLLLRMNHPERVRLQCVPAAS